MKSDIEIKDDVYEHIQASGIMAHLTGTLEKGKRPKGSRQEDVIISVLSNAIYGDRQEAYVNVNIYVQDIRRDGQYDENDPRLRFVCNLAKEALEVGGIGKDYSFHLDSQRVFEEPTDEHIINNRLFYHITTD